MRLTPSCQYDCNYLVATPSRLLHLMIEMNLDLKSMQCIRRIRRGRPSVRMSFQTPLTEILHRLPPSRQTLLLPRHFPDRWASLPRARNLFISTPRLESARTITKAFFSVKPAEKDTCLLVLLRDVIGVPLGSVETEADLTTDKQGKGKAPRQSI